MLDVSIEFDGLGIAEAMLTEAERKHYPFAAAKALTRTAQIVQKATQRSLGRQFELRNNWTERGIRVRPATKGKHEAAVFTRDWYMKDQLVGAVRQADGNGGWKVSGLLVPTIEARTTSSIAAPVARPNRPKQLFRKIERQAAAAKTKKRRRRGSKRAPRPFVATIAGKPGVFVRRFAHRRLPIVRLYTGVQGYRIARRWRFVEPARRMSDKQIRQQFLKAMRTALSTSRQGPRRSAYVEQLIRTFSR
jgi:hypothetical protein